MRLGLYDSLYESHYLIVSDILREIEKNMNSHLIKEIFIGFIEYNMDSADVFTSILNLKAAAESKTSGAQRNSA